jgi:succinate dehydrogenase/fumarate reductase flavoprotein subunit
MSSIKSSEVRNILESIEKASGRESETEWERIEDFLQQCDDEILKLRQENNELKKEVERLKEFEFMYKGLEK